MKLENYFLIYCPPSKHWPISFKFDTAIEPIFDFRETLKIKGTLYKKEIKNFYFPKNGSNYFD